ncbi:MAG: response regulator [Elusimicrobiota bacterium]
MATQNEKLILVIDDDEGVRDLLSFAVKKEGYRIETAEDGDVGLRQVLSLRPDLLILDLMLPRYGGFELLRELQGGDCAKMPIIVVTGRYTDRSTTDLIRQEPNVVALMEKPINFSALLRAIKRNLAPRVPPDAPEP